MPAVTRILLAAPAPLAAPDIPDLAGDLAQAGLQLLARVDCAELVRAALTHAPDLIVVWAPQATPALFDAVRAVGQIEARPVLVFTRDARAEAMQAALDAGIDHWVVGGYSADRLRALVQYTELRFRQQRSLRQELAELRQRLEERKLVDRAKGILMDARHLSEDEAFRLLRSASMHAKLRIGQLSQQVIDAALYAEATNRAGRLRMLSQRIVKLHALAVAGVDAAGSRALLADSRQQVDQLLAALEHSLSRPTFGDLLDAAAQSWAAMREALAVPASRASLARLDPQAERLLEQAERLTGALAAVGQGPSLSVINRSGRQRMLVQRLAKQALMASLLPEVALVPDDTVADFERSLTYLRDAPISTPPIREALAAAQVAWQQMLAGATHPGTAAGRLQLARASEELLTLFEDLTGRYEHSMQVLMG